MLLKLVLLTLSVGFLESKFSYEGYSLLKLKPQTSTHIKLIENWQNNPRFDLWNRIKGIDHGVDVLLSPKDKIKFKKLFKLADLPFNVTVQNIQEKLEEQEKSNKVKRSIDRSIVGKFARYSEIQSFLDDVVSGNPDLASTYIAGQTYEKRNLRVLVLKTPTASKSVWIDCGIHAREWISPATCVYMIENLIKEYKAGVQSTVALLDKYEFHILPVLNPDGYEYSHTSYRYWRKNRSPNRGSSCVGTDLNRNSDYKWMTGGSSDQPCSDVYAGPSGSSELEIKAMQSALRAKEGNWAAYLTFHAYGQWIFTPWGWTYNLPSDYQELMRVANIGKDAIQQVNGVKFVTGSSTHLLYVSSGGSEDWAKGTLGIKYAYCFELRPNEYASDGFNIAASKIPLAGAETLAGVKAMLAAIPA